MGKVTLLALFLLTSPAKAFLGGSRGEGCCIVMASMKLLVLIVLVSSSIGVSVRAEKADTSRPLWARFLAHSSTGSEPSALNSFFATVVESVTESKGSSDDGHGLGLFMDSLARGMSPKTPSRWRSSDLLKLVYPFQELATNAEGGPKEKMCDTCQALTLEMAMVLSDPDTPKQTEVFLETYMCDSLKDEQARKCKQLVEMYVPQLITTLQSEITPELCVQFGFCSPTAAPASIFGVGSRCDKCLTTARSFSDVIEEHTPNWNNARTALHASCDKSSSRCSQKKCHAAVESHTDKVMEIVDALSPAQMCRVAGLCRRPFAGRTLNGRVCGTCHFLVIEAKIELRKPKNQQKVLKYLEDTCYKLKGHEAEEKFVGQCLDMVKQYAPLFFDNIDQILDARTLCAKIGACPPRSQGEANDSILQLPSTIA